MIGIRAIADAAINRDEFQAVNRFPWSPPEPEPWNVGCGVCGAPPETPCTRHGSVVGWYHRSRLIAAGYRPKRRYRYVISGRKRRGHRRPEKLHKTRRTQENRRARHATKQALHDS